MDDHVEINLNDIDDKEIQRKKKLYLQQIFPYPSQFS